jgi:hypothetical protein
MIRYTLIEVIEDILEVREEIDNAARVLIGMKKNSMHGQEQIDEALSHLTIAVQIIGEPLKEEQS